MFTIQHICKYTREIVWNNFPIASLMNGNIFYAFPTKFFLYQSFRNGSLKYLFSLHYNFAIKSLL